MHHNGSKISLKNFIPLIIITTIIISFVIARQFYSGFDIKNAMLDFMAGFFIIFGSFKIINLWEFAQAYSTYDIIAQRAMLYAYIYPFIELGLGLCYLLRYQVQIANWITLIFMIIGSMGVAIELNKKRDIVCACLGTVFKIPMTYVTLAEDLIMGLMALIMTCMNV